MRGILAISAIQIAHFVPDKREYYTIQAMIQHQSGLQKATAILPRTNKGNCEAVLVFSTVTAFHTLAASRLSNEFLVVSETVGGGWLGLLKGAFSVLDNEKKCHSSAVCHNKRYLGRQHLR